MLENPIRRLLKIPDSPQPPQGNPESLQIFRASKKYYRYKLFMWLVKQGSALIGLFFFLGGERLVADYVEGKLGLDNFEFTGLGFTELFLQSSEMTLPMLSVGTIFSGLALLGIIGYLLQLVYTFLLLSLDYKQRWYMLTDTSLRIREGVTTVREQTMTFSNIQNLSIKQGPIQGLLGISDLIVQTAGGGGSSNDNGDEGKAHKSLHTGYFRGVDNAEAIRDLILGRLAKTHRQVTITLAANKNHQSPLLQSAEALLNEARAVRNVVAAQNSNKNLIRH